MSSFFEGTYYKHQALDGFCVAVIRSYTKEGPLQQVVVNGESFVIDEVSSILYEEDGIYFDIEQEGLKLFGKIRYGESSPVTNVMGPLSLLPVQCRHVILSTHHELFGVIQYNEDFINFNNGVGYIECNSGRSFPSTYLWINALKPDSSISLAYGITPLGLMKFNGVFAIIITDKNKYRFASYNGAKLLKLDDNSVVIKRNLSILTISLVNEPAKVKLKAPHKGKMNGVVYGTDSAKIHVEIKKKHNIIYSEDYDYASYQYKSNN